MIDGLLSNTMANMTWTDIKRCVDQRAVVLLPLGVIEEHGPHLCLGTDIYVAHLHSLLVKEKLERRGSPAVIAPPFYWGICQSTGGFLGSFRVRKDTAKALLVDILTSLAEFGFTSVYGINAHGDIEQSIVILEAFKEVAGQGKIDARYVFDQQRLPHFGLTGDEPFVCPLKPQTMVMSASEHPDVHAGDIETAIIHATYPHLADIEKAKSLPPTRLSEDKVGEWLWGGHIKELSADGYLGAPADFAQVRVADGLNDIADRIMTAILDRRSA